MIDEHRMNDLPPCGCELDEALTPPPDAVNGDLLARIAASVRGIRYGSVELVLHDGRVVQIERKEKLRL